VHKVAARRQAAARFMVRRNLLRSATEVNSTDALRGPLDLVLDGSMDADRFDALARSLTTQHSRRTTLGTLLGGVLLTASRETLAEHRKRSENRPGKRGGRAKPDHRNGDGKNRPKGSGKEHRQPQGQQSTQEQSLDPTAEVASAEAPELARDQVTTGRECRPPGEACRRGRQCCSGKCLRNGKCSCNAGSPCPQPADSCKEAVCSSGRCVIRNKPSEAPCTTDNNPCSKDVCDGSGNCTHPVDPAMAGQSCGDGKTCCGTACVDTQTDPDHCGSCNSPCPDTANTCQGSTCKCGDGPACSSNEICSGSPGTCVCAPPMVQCGGMCQTCMPDGGSSSSSLSSHAVSANEVNSLCCEPTNNGGYCQCGDRCCEGHCFWRQNTDGSIVGEFCCAGDNFVHCVSTDSGDKRDVCCECLDGSCPTCEACFALNPDESGRIGAVRRPGR
jgi:hypothetical protein